MEYAYLLVEGPHDAALVGKLLVLANLPLIRRKKDLDPQWWPLIPNQFPVNDDIVTRVPVPQFFQNEQFSVAVHGAGSDSQIPAALEESIETLVLKSEPIFQSLAVGAIIDADAADKTPLDRFNHLRVDILARQVIRSKIPAWPNQPGLVGAATPRTGIFVLPDNNQSGTLEDLLLEAATELWPNLPGLAAEFVESGRELLTEAERSELDKPAGLKKAQVACIGDLLRPGYSIQVSIKDDDWVSARSLALDRLRNLQAFVHFIVGLPECRQK